MTTTLEELLSGSIPESDATLRCRLVGTIDGKFALIDLDAQEFVEERSIPVSIDGLLKLLGDAGMQPRGGGYFPYGGRTTLTGRFEIDEKMGTRACLTDYRSIEVEVHRRNPIVITK